MGCQGSKAATAPKSAGTTLLQEPTSENKAVKVEEPKSEDKTVKLEESVAVTSTAQESATETPVTEPSTRATSAEVAQSSQVTQDDVIAKPEETGLAQEDAPLEPTLDTAKAAENEDDAPLEPALDTAEAAENEAVMEDCQVVAEDAKGPDATEAGAAEQSPEAYAAEDSAPIESPAEPGASIVAEVDVPKVVDTSAVAGKTSGSFNCLQFCRAAEAETEIVVEPNVVGVMP